MVEDGQLEWFAIYIAPQREFAAERILRDDGFRAFCPTETKLKRISRYEKRRVERAYPLLLRYIFVGFEKGRPIPWFNLFRFQMVLAVIARDGQPAAIPAKEMDRVFYMSKVPQPYRSSSNPHRSFQVGENVDIIAGPFAGRTVTVEDVKGVRAKIFVELFGVEREIMIPLEYLEVAA